MSRYFYKVIGVLRSVGVSCRDRGIRHGLRELKGKLWHRSCSILYVKQGGVEPVVVPEGIRIVTITAEKSQAFLSDILAAGAGSDIRFFDSGAICYLAYKNNHPVGLGWLFRDSYLLRKLLVNGYELSVIRNANNQQPVTNNRPRAGAYLAGFHVIDSARGQGIYPLLLNVMSREVGVQGMASYVDVAPGNQASIRGIEKAGFRRVGELRTVAVAGVIIRCKIEEDFTTDFGNEENSEGEGLHH
jgi:GNAT superfamily N-acetyltransferase